MATMAVQTPPAGSSGGSGPNPTTTTTNTPTTTTERLPMPSRNPLPLSASQEAQVREVFYDRVRNKCSAEIKAFAECALGRTFSVPFACREPHRVMNGCMKLHATPHEEDAAREEWFAQRTERARQRMEKQKRKEEQARFMREWWGIEESERDEARRRAEEEKMRRGERVGGFRSRGRSGEGGEGAGSS